jgi:hypothetical protein
LTIFCAIQVDKLKIIYVLFIVKTTEKITYSGAEWSVLLTQYRAGDKIEKNEMGGACGTYWGRERCVQGSGGET